MNTVALITETTFLNGPTSSWASLSQFVLKIKMDTADKHKWKIRLWAVVNFVFGTAQDC